MAEDLIRYDILAQDALRGVVKKVLTEVASTGLPGEHHFYITFNTQAPGVKLSPRLMEKYPSDMTIVLQHQFWDMQANDQNIIIGLSFDGIPEKLHIPYTAIITFIDPSVHFSLQFEVEDEMDEDIMIEEESPLSLVSDADAKDEAPEQEEKAEAKEEPEAEASEPEEATSEKNDADSEETSEEDNEEEAEVDTGAQVVSLDAFRKK